MAALRIDLVFLSAADAVVPVHSRRIRILSCESSLARCDHPIQQCYRTMIGAEPVWNFAIVLDAKYREIRVLTRLDAALPPGHAQSPRAVDCGRRDCFRR